MKGPPVWAQVLQGLFLVDDFLAPWAGAAINLSKSPRALPEPREQKTFLPREGRTPSWRGFKVFTKLPSVVDAVLLLGQDKEKRDR